MKEYPDALAYLYGLEKFGIVFGLENVQRILEILGNPQKHVKAVHIGGTNGKGSVASMLASILSEAGYRVGKYTSPHLVLFTERITVDKKEITEAEVAELTAEIRETIQREDPKRAFTFFDFTTALAYEYFRRQETDIAIVEVGLGGRLDSTNVIDPLVSIITNVGFDHMDYLGNTIAEIAREKAGIIKGGVPVVTGACDGAREIIEEIARGCKSPVYALGTDFGFKRQTAQVMSYTGPSMGLENVFVNLKGDHQLVNGTLALCAAELLKACGFPVEEGSIRKGLSRVKWPGRLEIVRERPTILLDGAHNMDGVQALVRFLEARFPEKRTILIFGAMKDKEYGKILDLLRPRADVIVLTRPANERGLLPEVMRECAGEAVVTEDVRSALSRARDVAGDRDLILVTGSLYLVGEARAIIDEVF
ncbi:MAG: Folylpolyglutamate synthase [Syntrophorhabdus sp. PtaU1.Bin153]|nr:MAG: Folylpolyglutamate synthase [Syntrophorhabdus sp. PtaU1.Bin153]